MTDPIAIRPWSTEDRPLLDALLGSPEMTVYLGGPEQEEKRAERQGRYEKPGSRQYVVLVDGQPAGYVGYWERDWQGGQIWETGWSVVPELQGRGVASAGMRLLLEVIRNDDATKSVHAFPSVDNAASNALCRKIGFELLGTFDFEYPPGHPLRCNDWAADLRPGGSAGGSG